MIKDMDSFWQWVEQRMEEVHISSYRDLAKKSGLSSATILNRKNDRKAPTVEIAEGLCQALRVDWVELWARAGYIEANAVPSKSDLEGLEAEINFALQGTGDDFKNVVLKTVRLWRVLYEELKNPKL